MKPIVTLVVLLCSLPLLGQSLSITQKGWQSHFYYQEEQLPIAQVWPLLQNNPQSQGIARKAKWQLRTARWAQGAAALVLGIQMAHWGSGGSPPKWQWAAPAVLVLGTSIPLEKKGKKKLKKAIKVFNKGRKSLENRNIETPYR